MPKATFNSRSTRPAFRSLEGWATGLLTETHAIVECVDHGHRRDRSDPDAWRRARVFAQAHPFPGFTPQQCVAAVDEIMESIGDTCPDCER